MNRRQRGTGRIFLPEGSSIWWMQYYKNGVKQRESSETSERKRALDRLKHRIAEVTVGTFTGLNEKKVRISELAEDFLRDYRINGKASIDDAEARWRIHIEPFFGKLRTSQVKLFNVYDILVMALDENVLQEQIVIAKTRLATLPDISMQKRLNFEMSVRMLQRSLSDRERVEKIQGLLNELLSFLEDELSIVTGSYQDLLTLDDVLENDLILFVSLNTNRNQRAVEALGKILLQNIQLMVGKRYAQSSGQRDADEPMLSVILDEFAPFSACR